MSEPKISNSDGKKFCTVNFGGNENNTLTLKLNDDNSVVNEEILVKNSVDYQSGTMAEMLLSVSFITPIIDANIKAYWAVKKKDINVNIKSDDKQMRFSIDLARNVKKFFSLPKFRRRFFYCKIFVVNLKILCYH